jgi:glyoxylase-like metal-dependent hydrolase (beta-lactamase superfamily II)
MKVHHLNCATMCPLNARLINGEGGFFSLARGRMICHCLLVETGGGLALVDTGFGLGDLASPKRLGRAFVALTHPRLDPAETAIRQVERLGFRAEDVQHIVLTHLDPDHAGGLGDFPWAKVHVHAPEHAAAMARATLREQERYIAAQWAHGPDWALYAAGGEPWFGFSCVRGLSGLPPEILMVPLTGHTRGHAAIAVETGGGWLLHAGDAYFYREEMASRNPHCTPALGAFQHLVAMDDEARLNNQGRLRQLVRERGAEVRVFSAHDPVELEREQGWAARRDSAR